MTPARLAPAAGLVAALLGLACSAEPPAVDPQLSQAALLASSCSGCHGDGGSAAEMPQLAGRDAEELVALFLRYRSEEAGSSVMHRLARGYPEAQVRAIAEYLAGQ
jgi:sulfide dehydrogenase cytochrome subunit